MGVKPRTKPVSSYISFPSAENSETKKAKVYILEGFTDYPV